jgi:hypothetical protein
MKERGRGSNVNDEGKKSDEEAKKKRRKGFVEERDSL